MFSSQGKDDDVAATRFPCDLDLSKPYNRMRGGGGAESLPADAKASKGRHGGGVPQSSISSGGSGAPVSRQPTQQANPQESPPAPRATLTIFTEIEDGSGDDVRVDSDGAIVPNAEGQHSVSLDTGNSTSASFSKHLLKQTATCLSPMHYYNLYGNGLAHTESAYRGFGTANSVSDFLSPGMPGASSNNLMHLDASNSGGAAPYSSTLPEDMSSFSFAMTCGNSGSGEGPLVSATPVVPLTPYTGEGLRKKAAAEFERKFSAAAAKAAGEAKLAAAQAAARAEAEKRDPKAEKERKKRDKEKAKELKKKQKEIALIPPRVAREQMIRIGAERLQQRLSELHLVGHRVKNDGNCQFRAISQQLFGSEEYHDLIRSHVVSYMRRVREKQFDFFFESKAHADTYFANLAKIGTWGDELTLRGASDSLFLNIHVLSSEERNCYITYRPSPDAPPAPSFLVDVAKVRERRRTERQFKRSLKQRATVQESGSLEFLDPDYYSHSCPDRVPHSVHHDCNAGVATTVVSKHEVPNATTAQQQLLHHSGPMSNSGSERAGGPKVQKGDEESTDDDIDLDASALQHVLQEKLAKARIRSCAPYFIPDGSYVDTSAAAQGGSSRPSFSHCASFPGNSTNWSGAEEPMPSTVPIGTPAAHAGRKPPLIQPPSTINTPQVATLNASDSLKHGLIAGDLKLSPTPTSAHRSIAVGARHSSITTAPPASSTQTTAAAGAAAAAGPPLNSISMGHFNASSGSGSGGGSYTTPGATKRSAAVSKFVAAGAEVHTTTANESVTIFRQTSEQQPLTIFTDASPTNPTITTTTTTTKGGMGSGDPAGAGATAASLGNSAAGTSPGAASSSVIATPMAPPPARLLRPVCSKRSHPLQSSGPSNDSAFPVFPTHEGGNVMLLASNPRSATMSLRQSFANLSSAMSLPQGGYNNCNAAFSQASGSFDGVGGGAGGEQGVWGDGDGEDEEDDDVCFIFESRSEPIDIFLSYLYPVHYNALAVYDPEDATSDSPPIAPAVTAGGGGAAADNNTTTSLGGQYLSAPFLRKSNSMCEGASRSLSFMM